MGGDPIRATAEVAVLLSGKEFSLPSAQDFSKSNAFLYLAGEKFTSSQWINSTALIGLGLPESSRDSNAIYIYIYI